MRRFAAVLGLVAAISAGSAFAQSTLTATNAGLVDAGTIYSSGPSANIFTGSSSGQFRSYLTFTVPVSQTAFTSAVLNLDVSTVTGGPNILDVFDVTSNLGTDSASTVFADLGGGTYFGTGQFVSSGQVVQITLNTAGLAAVNAARGSTITFGFLNATNGGGVDGIFGASSGSSPRELILTPTAVAPAPVPTMGEWAMILFGVVMAGGAALYIQRRRQFA